MKPDQLYQNVNRPSKHMHVKIEALVYKGIAKVIPYFHWGIIIHPVPLGTGWIERITDKEAAHMYMRLSLS
jgi:hypothetical protein